MISTAKNVMRDFHIMEENRLLVVFVSFSLLAHLLVLVASRWNIFTPSLPLIEEWAMESELMHELDGGVEKTKLPDAKKDDEAAVPAALLPQLPKKFALDEPQKDEEGIIEPDRIEEKKPAEVSKKGDDKIEPVLDSDKDASNKIAMQEAMKRLAMERLRKENERQRKAEEIDSMASIKDGLNQSDLSRAALSLGDDITKQKYGTILNRSIRRHYTLPQTFKSSIASLRVVLAMIVNERGELVSIQIHQSSNDQVFDEYTVGAAKNAAPFARPPQSLAGNVIYVTFTR